MARTIYKDVPYRVWHCGDLIISKAYERLIRMLDKKGGTIVEGAHRIVERDPSEPLHGSAYDVIDVVVET